MNLFKHILAGVLLLGLLTAFHPSDTDKAKKVKFTCEFDAATAGDSLYLLRFVGTDFEQIDATSTKDGRTFLFQIPKSKHKFYYVGTADGKVKSVILGAEKTVLMTGNFRNLRRASVATGVNKIYKDGMAESRKLSGEQIDLSRKFSNAQDKASREKITLEMLVVDQKKRDLLRSLEKESPYVAKLIGLYTFYSFQNNQGEYPNDLSYFADNYLAQADLNDKVYQNLPLVYDAFRNYAVMLSKTPVDDKQLEQIFDKAISKAPKSTSTYQFALGGITMATRAQNRVNLFIKYGSEYVKLYKDAKNPLPSVLKLEQQVKLASGFLPGAVAPDFTAKTPEGEAFSLSELRGKVVLVDFWASWCGPCRRDNPHVVKLYKKYKDQGFDVLGVSLDKTKSKWVAAIEKDGLEWNHISDLKGWQNEIAKMYSVTSIPHTVLLDREGRIIGRKLRGPALDAKLREIFGK